MRDQPCTGSNRLDFHSVSETLTWNTAAGWWWPVESLRVILPFRKSFERAQQPWNTGSTVSINRLMKWLGRKKENRWKKEREKEEEKRTQKWRKSKRSEQTFQRFRADTGKRAVGLERAYIVWISEWAEYKERERERETRKTYQCWCMRVGWKETQVGEKENRQRVTLTKDRWSIEDDRSFCAYASFSGVGNYATAGSGGRWG